jgi:uncharacterized protein (TIGR00269 family)
MIHIIFMKQLQLGNYNQRLEERIMRVILDYNLIDSGELVAVALSGGKDSVLTLHILDKFRKSSDFDFDLLAIAIDEGISGYREEGMAVARKNARDLDVELFEISLEKELGFTIDQASECYQTACVSCGVFRRYLLNRTAFEVGADKLATGHNLDDEVQSFLMSFARADTRRFGKFGPKLQKIHPKLVPRIKPLWLIPEKEVGIWVVLNEVDAHLAECPYAHLSLRSRLKTYLNNLEEYRPGTKLNILKFFQKSFIIDKSPTNLFECQICGEPSSALTCKACEMRRDIKLCLKS